MNGSIEIEQNTTKGITNPNENNEMEKPLETLHIWRKKWRTQNMNEFFCVNDVKKFDLANL